jgi:hypothetical protein
MIFDANTLELKSEIEIYVSFHYGDVEDSDISSNLDDDNDLPEFEIWNNGKYLISLSSIDLTGRAFIHYNVYDIHTGELINTLSVKKCLDHHISSFQADPSNAH